MPFFRFDGTNPQPSNDEGSNDVGNLLPAFNPTALPDPAEFNFPDVPVSNAACPPPS
jgi:hypothetical protein